MRPPRVAVVLVVLAATALACSSTSDKDHAERPERGDVLPAPQDVPITEPALTSTTDVTPSTITSRPNGRTPIELPPASTTGRGTLKIGVLTWKAFTTSLFGSSFNF